MVPCACAHAPPRSWRPPRPPPAVRAASRGACAPGSGFAILPSRAAVRGTDLCWLQAGMSSDRPVGGSVPDYAVIALGGKQYRVQQGEQLLVDRLAHRENYRGGNLQRWQVIDESQMWYRTFKSLQAAVQCLEDRQGDSSPDLRRVG